MLTAEQFIQQMEKLVGFETLTGNTQEIHKCYAYIRSLLDPQAHIEEISHETAPSLLASNRLTKTPDIMFLAHIDVVPAIPSQFSLQIDGDMMRGRGVSDMKFSIPLGVDLLNDVIARQDNKSFLLAFTSDEENGGFSGAKRLATECGYQPKILIVLDGGDNMQLVVQSKGIEVLTIKVKGKTAHACKPYEGSNPLHTVTKIAAALLVYCEQDGPFSPETTTMFIDEIVGPTLEEPQREDASLSITLSYPPSVTRKEIHAALHEIMMTVDPTSTVTVEASAGPLWTDVNHPAFQLLQSLLEQELHHPVDRVIQPGGTDARHFAETNPLVLLTKPVGGDLHGINEHISIESCMSLLHVLLEFVRQFRSN